MSKQQAIGIFDSGVGGLSVLKAVHQLMPGENLIYVADTRHTPYGCRSTEFIEHRVHAIAKFLVERQVKLIVVACNTATAAAVHLLRQNYHIPIIGLEPALKPAVESSSNERIGVLATQATLDSQKYQKLRARFVKHANIIEKASPLFVELVESAPTLGQSELELIEKELKPFVEAKVGSLVLGCTHFPFLTQAITRIMGSKVKLFESAMPVANEVKRRLQNDINGEQKTGWTQYYSSEPQKARKTFELLLGEAVELKNFTT